MNARLNSVALAFLLLALLAGCASEHPAVSVTGTWTGHVKDTACARCESWLTMDLSETAAGNVTGVFGDHSHDEVDFSTSAAYVVGSRTGDSISLIATMPCDSMWSGTTLRFLGWLSRGGDSVSGELAFTWSTHSDRIPLVLSRGPIDSNIFAEMRNLKIECHAAA